MWVDKNGVLYAGDCAAGDRLATPDEVNAWFSENSTVQSISALQGLLAIDQAGLSSAYEAWANDPARTFAERAFIDKAMTWRRDNAVMAAAAGALNITEAQLDQLFILAATL